MAKSLISNQEELSKLIKKAINNYSKSPKARITSSYIETRLESLKTYWAKFQDNHDNITRSIDKSEQAKLEYFTEDLYDQVEELYTDYHSKMKEDLKSFSQSSTSATSTNVIASSPSCDVRLPQINLPTFTSGYEEWQSFHDLFVSLIHNNEKLTSVQKMHYLKSCLRGEAEQVLKNLTITEANYHEAWLQLTRRYNNRRFNTNEVLKTMFSQKTITESSTAVKRLLDTTSACLKSLNNLKIDITSWDTIINYVVVTKLDQESRKQWELHLSQISMDELPSWNQLKDFLETRYRTMEMLEGVKQTPTTWKAKTFHAIENKKTISCGMCHSEHYLYQCKKFSNLTPKERSELVKEKGLCFNCLAPNHSVNKCHQSTSCRRCGRRHHSLLHLEREQEKEKAQETTENIKTQSKESTTIVSTFAKQSSPCEVLLATAIVRAMSVNGVSHVIRALIDQGSQASFITEETVQLLGLKRQPINGLVSGVGDGHTRVKYMVSLHITSRHPPYNSIKVNAYVLSSLTTMLPSKVIHSPDWLELEMLPLADPSYLSPSKIDVLLGAEVYCEILKGDVIKNPTRRLIAQNTILGWIVSGKMSESGSSERVISMHTQIRAEDLLKRFWELEQETEINQKILPEEEKKCEEIFASTTTRNEDGRYVVRLPFNSVDPECQYGNMLKIAQNRFMSLENKLARNPKLSEEYAKVIEEYKTLNHMKPVPKDDIDNPKAVYLPHHAVVKEDRDTTKVRVVFDASCKGVNDVSLNDNLLVGPKLQQDLQHLLLRWRIHRIAIIADLIKMYRQVRVHEEDVNYQRILWRPNRTESIEHYQLLTLTFGTDCAPYLAVKALHQLAEDEKLLYPIGAEITKNDLYMDDLMTGCETESEAIIIFEELSNLMKLGGFQFQKWSSNSNTLLELIGQDGMTDNQSIPIKLDETLKILGMTWNRCEDRFEYVVKLPPLSTPVTKRKVLSDIAMLFDPLGWVAPTIITAKAFIQKLWLAGIEWDQELPENMLKEWITYRQDLYTLAEFRIPRWIGSSISNKRLELQGFCDASNIAYAAVVYARVIDHQGEVIVNLLRSRTKVAPVKQVSIPRLELCGAVLLAKLLSDVSQVLQVPKENIHAWTDSSVVIAWLSSHPSKWKTFVANRVSEILTKMDSNQWSHVPSEENPADCASKGIKAKELIGLELWKKGPKWLSDKEIKYSKGIFKNTSLEEKASKKICLLANVMEENDSEGLIGRFSSLTRMLRVLSYCRRWSHYRTSQGNQMTNTGSISVQEMNDTLLTLVGVVQAISFKEEIDSIKSRGCVLKRSTLHTLCPILDSKGTLRVGGRLERSELTYERKHPIILPAKNHLTWLVIQDAHFKTLHGGPQLMLNYIRYTYFIINARVQVKKYYRNCVKCRRYSSANRSQLMGQIPDVRLKPSKPFKSSGVDYAGPINVRFSPGRGSKAYKGYICLFVCMVTRAVHLEVVSDLTAKGFIAAFRRFIARRGHCKDLYSDNATNFVGSNKLLFDMLKAAQRSWPEEIAQLLTSESTTWHFNPPHAPNFGGLWEAGVRSVKNHLRKTIGDSALIFEELSTVLTQIEACLNSRPLSVLSSDPNDPLPLTPGHFLVGEPLISISDQDQDQSEVVGIDRWRMVQKMVSIFWKRWSREYLSNISQRYKWYHKGKEPELGEVVLIKNDNVPPAKWQLGTIVEKYTGKDNITRVVSIRTINGTKKRPMSKVCVLTK
ncbi:uncharacterized protein LOC106709163 [Papilio machaon]|uniref:uncharacterized protein LOC106709163 n=1 Tax=Papilio machaon TaxID=76193 RepID=UPI001E663575|nr:uncharacterized protein LOC106709163 [Papilio machaon]